MIGALDGVLILGAKHLRYIVGD